MFWKWQWVIAGKGVQPDNIYTAVFTNCKTPERRSKVSLVALIIWQVFDGAISCDTTWRNKWSSIPGKQSKHFQYFGGLSAKGDDVHESRFILPLILWRWTTRTKGLEGKRKREYLNGTAKIKSTVIHVSGKKYIVFKYFELCPWWQDSIANWHFCD